MAILLAGLALLVLPARLGTAKEITLLNVSYDPTRELYQEVNAAFGRHWLEKTGDTVTVKQCEYRLQAPVGCARTVIPMLYNRWTVKSRNLLIRGKTWL